MTLRLGTFVWALMAAVLWSDCGRIRLHKGEGTYLEYKFGDDYLRYKQRVRRWL